MSGVDIDSYRTCMDSTEMEEVVAASVHALNIGAEGTLTRWLCGSTSRYKRSDVIRCS